MKTSNNVVAYMKTNAHRIENDAYSCITRGDEVREITVSCGRKAEETQLLLHSVTVRFWPDKLSISAQRNITKQIADHLAEGGRCVVVKEISSPHTDVMYFVVRSGVIVSVGVTEYVFGGRSGDPAAIKEIDVPVILEERVLGKNPDFYGREAKEFIVRRAGFPHLDVDLTSGEEFFDKDSLYDEEKFPVGGPVYVLTKFKAPRVL